MNMREQFIQTTKELLKKDNRIALILSGISVASFSDCFNKYPYRAFDAGISEQAVVSIASGMSITGMIPIIHSIAPFIVERAYEQIKLDFGYQKQRGNIITTGASLDYSSFGATHQCPADISILKQVNNLQVVVPGTAEEFDMLYKEGYDNDCLSYFRLSRDTNIRSQNVVLNKAKIIKKGTKATIITVGPMLDIVNDAVKELDVTVLYYTTLSPFDKNILKDNCENGKVVVCTPFYKGALLEDIVSALEGKMYSILEIGLPIAFTEHYGFTCDHYKDAGLTSESIYNQINKLIDRG